MSLKHFFVIVCQKLIQKIIINRKVNKRLNQMLYNHMNKAHLRFLLPKNNILVNLGKILS